MPTLREQILEISNLPSPDSVRDHLLSYEPGSGGGEGETIIVGLIQAEANVNLQDITVDVIVEDKEVITEVEVEELSVTATVEILDEDIETSATVNNENIQVDVEVD